MNPIPRRFVAHQHGSSLIELLVGLTISLAITGIAIATLHVSRQLADTTSELTHLQQQAAYALRVIGGQVRQAGSVRLQLAVSHSGDDQAAILSQTDPADPVVLATSFVEQQPAVSSSASRPLQVAYARYQEPLHHRGTRAGTSLVWASQMRDCQGGDPDAEVVISRFYLSRTKAADPTGQLMCHGNSNEKFVQPIIADVADFQVRWLLQEMVAGEPRVREIDASQAALRWNDIYAVEVCLEMAGSQPIPTLGSTYRPCQWRPGDRERDRGNRLRLVYRSVYQLRSQGGF